MSSRPLVRRPLLARRGLLVLPLLAGCADRLVPLTATGRSDAARALLADSAAAHGLEALGRFKFVDVSYAGVFERLVDRLQPELVDAARRSTARDRLDLRSGSIIQDQAGPGGTKRVERTPGPHAQGIAGQGTVGQGTVGQGTVSQGTVRVSFDGTEATDRPRRDASAVVADCYLLFLLGPMLLAGRWSADRALVLAMGAAETMTVDGQDYACDVLRVSMRPGLGLSEGDELVLWIDRRERLMRRVRFTLNGHVPTRGAVAETDCARYFEQGGVRWASQFEERLLRPLPLDVHRWRMVGFELT